MSQVRRQHKTGSVSTTKWHTRKLQVLITNKNKANKEKAFTDYNIFTASAPIITIYL